MAEVAAEEIESWPAGQPYAVRPAMQRITLEVIIRTVFGVQDDARRERLRATLAAALEWGSDPRRMAMLAVLGPQRLARSNLFRRVRAPADELIYEEIRERRGATDLERARRRAVAAAAGPPRGRQRDDRRGAARRADDAAGGGPRDDRLVAGLGGRAAGAQPARAGAAARRGRGRRRRVRGRRLQGDAAPAADPGAGAAPPDRADGDRRPAAARRGRTWRPASTSSTGAPTSIPSRTPSAPSASSSSRPAPTPGSRSAAACAAAWAPASRCSRCGSCCASWSAGSSCAPRTRGPSGSPGARSRSCPSAAARSWWSGCARAGPAAA